MDQARRAPPVANAGQNPESRARGGVPAVVPGFAAGGRASGGVTPRLLMLSWPNASLPRHHKTDLRIYCRFGARPGRGLEVPAQAVAGGVFQRATGDERVPARTPWTIRN